jgi:hypothetical protein
MPPAEFLLGEWRPSPCYDTHFMMRNYKVVPAVVGLFEEPEHVRFYALGMEWLIPKGTPHIAMLMEDEMVRAPHEPPARLR